MTPVRRFLVMLSWMLWVGGFTFYAAVVVPIGTDHLGSAREQGLITQRVTDYLNAIGGGCVVLTGWDVLSGRAYRRGRGLLLAVAAVTLALLVWQHPQLDAMIGDDGRLADRKSFYGPHARYLIVSTVQWAAMLALIYLSLLGWRADDRTDFPKEHS